MSKHHHCYSHLQSKEGLHDLNLIIEELGKIHPNPSKLKEFKQKYGIKNSKNSMQLMEDIILFLDRQKFHKISDREL